MRDEHGDELSEPKSEVEVLAFDVIGAAIEVHRRLGPGFLECVYDEALCIELALRGVPFARQVPILVDYKSKTVGTARLDLVVGGLLVIELKAVDRFAAIHTTQLLSYLKAANLSLGLLINFNVEVLRWGIRRAVRGG